MNMLKSDPAPAAALSLEAASEDLAALAWLHESERDVTTLCRLHAAGFPGGLTVAPPDMPALAEMDRALSVIREVGEGQRAALQDDLNADFASIYLTHALRASPCESVWLDDESLMMQGPSFAVRDRYREHGLKAANWRHIADDHLANELAFIAHLLAHGHAGEACRFIDEHLMQWLPRFAGRVADRASTRFYAALATLTLHVVERLRQQLNACV